MDKFDQWYNKKMDEQEVAYSESSWDSFSEQLNHLPSDRNRRRPFMYFWLLALCLSLGGGSIFAWQASKSASDEKVLPFSTQDQEGLPIHPSTNETSGESKHVGENIPPVASQELPGSATESNTSNAESLMIASGNEYGTKTLGSFENSLNRSSTTKQSVGSISSAPTLNNESGKQQINSAESENEHTVQANHFNIAGANSHSQTSEGDANRLNEELSEAAHPSLKNELLNHSEASVNVAFNHLPESQVIEPLTVTIRSLENGIEYLPQLALSSNNLEELAPTIVACCSFKGWTHHIELGAQFYPGINEGSRFFTGLQAAYHLQYRWAQRWSASAGAGVLQRWGSFGGFQDSPQDIYTTTRERRGFLLVPTSATYMQFPTMVSFHAGKHIIGAGVRSLLLIGVQGQLDEYSLQRNENEAEFSLSSNTINTGWINESGFRSIVPEYLLTYSYQFNQHWSFSFSGAWMPNGIVYADKNSGNLDKLSSLTFDSGSSQQPFLLEDKWQAGISLRFKF